MTCVFTYILSNAEDIKVQGSSNPSGRLNAFVLFLTFYKVTRSPLFIYVHEK